MKRFQLLCTSNAICTRLMFLIPYIRSRTLLLFQMKMYELAYAHAVWPAVNQPQSLFVSPRVVLMHPIYSIFLDANLLALPLPDLSDQTSQLFRLFLVTHTQERSN